MLSVNRLSISLKKNSENHLLINDVTFEIPEGNVYSIIGKNGEGKSTLIKSITKLLPEKFFNISGKVTFKGENIFDADEKSLMKIRNEKIKYVFQDPQTSFDPLKKTEYYFQKIYNCNTGPDELLDYFLLPEKEKLYKMYPHELSGGMAQRLLIVLTLLKNPDMIILDEPTSALDTPVSNLLCRKLHEFAVAGQGKSVLVITQDTTFAENVSDKIAALSAGKLTEFLEVEKIQFK